MRKGISKKLYTVPVASTPQDQLWKHIEALDLPDIRAYRDWCRAQGFLPGLNKDWRQRQQERLRAKRLAEQECARRERLQHICYLGLQNWDEYDAWCLSRGFSTALNKSPQQLAQEIHTGQREKASAALAQSRVLRRKPKDFIQAVFDGRIPVADIRNDAEREIFNFAAGYCRSKPEIRAALLRLILRFGCDPDDLTERPAVGNLGWQESNNFLNGLGRLARAQSDWLRTPETWKPEFGSPRRRFGSLARHLLVCYPVPSFLDAGWFEEPVNGQMPHRDWFLHIGLGQNIRTANLPFPLTKMAAHHFLKAPGDLTIVGALRWGQILGMGGSTRLARAIAGSRLNEIQLDEPFWATVLMFFANNPMLDPAQVGPILDYLYHQKYVPQEILGPGGHIEHTGPPQPGLTMKGRSATALLRLVQDWHQRLAQEKRPAREWARTGIQECSLLLKDTVQRDTLWTIQELLSTKELHQEGRFMSNCVATYAESCARGQSSIWSLRRRAGGESLSVRVMTIEVCNSTRQIVQARGRFNRTPDDCTADGSLKAAPDVLRHWAAIQSLTLSEYAW